MRSLDCPVSTILADVLDKRNPGSHSLMNRKCDPLALSRAQGQVVIRQPSDLRPDALLSAPNPSVASAQSSSML